MAKFPRASIASGRSTRPPANAAARRRFSSLLNIRSSTGRLDRAMARNPRYDVLLEPVRIGPVTAPNRFYAVPHAAGMTNAMPHMRASFRGTKAEGGWGVVCSGYVSIDPTSDDAPLPFATLWDDDDIRSHALMTEAVHSHGALAGLELWHGGGSVMNRRTRTPPLSPSGTSWMGTAGHFMGHPRLT